LQQQLYYHSPFSKTTSFTEKNKALLLSFALSEIFHCTSELSKTWDHPSSFEEKTYDAPLNILQEHSTLLLIAFPVFISSLIEFKEKTSSLIYFLRQNLSFSPKNRLKELFLLLQPLIKQCKDDENFLFFLISHYKEINWILDSSYLPSLFNELYPDSSKLHTLLCDHFHKKGLTRLLPEITFLLNQLKQGT